MVVVVGGEAVAVAAAVVAAAAVTVAMAVVAAVAVVAGAIDGGGIIIYWRPHNNKPARNERTREWHDERTRGRRDEGQCNNQPQQDNKRAVQ